MRPSQGARDGRAITVLLVQHRDDAFETLAGELAVLGVRAIRATSNAGALSRYVCEPADLLVVDGDQPGESAWLLAAKLRLTHPAARVWVYLRFATDSDVSMANHLAVDELIEYGGEVLRLATEMLQRLDESFDLPRPGRPGLAGKRQAAAA
jgi:response regulator RpfG family c-di-GMP phosphodiesterase